LKDPRLLAASRKSWNLINRHAEEDNLRSTSLNELPKLFVFNAHSAVAYSNPADMSSQIMLNKFAPARDLLSTSYYSPVS
jgi:hypothetical protein